MEMLTTKERLGITSAAAMLASGAAISWGCPEVFFGWSIPAICGVWLGLAAAMTAAVSSAALIVRMIVGAIRWAAEREIREECAQLFGRDGMYVDRVTVCRAAETFGNGR